MDSNTPKTLRDEFAMAALTGIVSIEAMFVVAGKEARANNTTTEDQLAVTAYQIADAMLKQRLK